MQKMVYNRISTSICYGTEFYPSEDCFLCILTIASYKRYGKLPDKVLRKEHPIESTALILITYLFAATAK